MSVMTEKINSYKADVAALSGVLPRVAEAYHRFTGACFEPGELDTGTKHLIALGVALFANNEACTYYHAGEALDHGASERQVMEAAAVAAAACGGHALSQGVMRVLGVLGQGTASGYAQADAIRREPAVSEGAGWHGGWNGGLGATNGHAGFAGAAAGDGHGHLSRNGAPTYGVGTGFGTSGHAIVAAGKLHQTWADEKRFVSRPDHTPFDPGPLGGEPDDQDSGAQDSFPNIEKVSPSF